MAGTGGGEQRVPVGAEANVAGTAGVAGQLFELVPARGIPDRDAFVVARGCQPRPVGAERDAPNGVVVGGDVCPQAARPRLPQAHRAVHAGGGHELAVRADGHPRHAAGVRAKRDPIGPAVGRPETNRLVGSARDEPVAVGTEREAGDRAAQTDAAPDRRTIATPEPDYPVGVATCDP